MTAVPVSTRLTSGTPAFGPAVASSPSLQRERRILIDEQEQVRLHPRRPAEAAEPEVVERTRIAPGEQDREPRHDRRDPPREAERPDAEELRDGEDGAE